jgi:outer membrane protein
MVVMSEDAKREKAMEFERKVNDMQQVYVQMQKDLSDREREMMKGIFDKMESIIKDLAQAGGYTYVFEQQNAGLLVAPPSADMTNDLISKYNAKYKVAGAPAAKKGDAKKSAAPAAK